MRVLTALTYYRPYVSGLTIYTERLAEALARRGHQVTVLTSQFDPALPREEVREGVLIVRAPVVMRISKGVIMPTIGDLATKLVAQNDVVHLHLPQFDAAGIALRGRLMQKPTILTYHCDVKLPPGWFNQAANYAVNIMNNIAAISAHRIVTYTEDYARHSPYARRHFKKVTTILPPVELPKVSSEDIACFAQKHQIDSHRPVIGMAARFAAEKGVEVLLGALAHLLEIYPQATVLFAGQYQDVLGEEEYAKRLLPVIQKFEAESHWKFLGMLDPSEMAAFYPNLDVLVVPSLNSTESFGLVQIEAMMSGVPVVASDLPGVRQPVSITGMGKITPPGKAVSLAGAIREIVDQPQDFQGDPMSIKKQFSAERAAQNYENLYEEIASEIHV